MVDELAQVKEPNRIEWPSKKTDHADGIYFRMPEDEYHADTALGASGIVDLNVSPLKYWKGSAFNPKKEKAETDEKETAAIIRGNYFHEAIAGFRSSYVVKPEGMSFATKEGKDFKASRPGATFIKAEDAAKAQEMIDAMRETGVLERVGGIGGGIQEVSFFWTDKQGRRRKMRADRLYQGQMFDWKTMANSMSKDLETLVAHTVAQHRYHTKAYWYQGGIQAMKHMINTKGAAAFMSETAESEYMEMLALAQSEAIVPFWYVFIENGGIPNVVPRRFVSHDSSKNLNAYFRGAKQDTDRALGVWDANFAKYGTAKPWYPEAVFKEFADEDFMSARWILATD